MISVGGSTGNRMPSTSNSSACPVELARDHAPLQSVQDVDHGVVEVGLEQPVLRRSFDPQPGRGEGAGRRLDVLLGDHEIHVVERLRARRAPTAP